MFCNCSYVFPLCNNVVGHFLIASLLCRFVSVQMQQSLFVIHMWCETETQLMFPWDVVRRTNRNVSNLFYSTDEEQLRIFD